MGLIRIRSSSLTRKPEINYKEDTSQIFSLSYASEDNSMPGSSSHVMETSNTKLSSETVSEINPGAKRHSYQGYSNQRMFLVAVHRQRKSFQQKHLFTF